MRFGPDYREELTLRDGTPFVLRLIRPDDKDNLRDGLAHMSEDSRYRRFFTAKPRLSGMELAYLTEVDGYDHFALVAGIEQDDGSEEGLGVGRFIRSKTDPGTAEAAVAVVDERQGQGLGTLLLERLADAARERDVQRFSADFLSLNEPVKSMLDHLSSHVEYHPDGTVVHAVVPLDDEPVTHRETDRPAVHHVLGEIARGNLTAREGLRLLKQN